MRSVIHGLLLAIDFFVPELTLRNWNSLVGNNQRRFDLWAISKAANRQSL